MALVENVDEKPLILTGGATLEVGGQENVDLGAANEAAMYAAGSLRLLDGGVPPPVPAAVRGLEYFDDATGGATLANGATGTVLTSTGVTSPPTWSPATSSGHTIEDEGTALTARTSLNFVGAGVTATDAGGKTVVTVPGGSSTAGGVTFAPGGSIVATDVQAAIDELDAEKQPLDSDLTAIAALATTAYGRAFLALVDAAAGRTALGLGSAATQASSAFEVAGAAAAAQAASQPADSDLTSIAALTTTSYGRALLALADAAAGRTAFGLGTAAVEATGAFDVAGAAAAAQAASQPLNTPVTTLLRNRQTASYTPVLADAGKVIEQNVASANNVTIPPSIFPVDTVLYVCQYGAGQVTLVPGAGVTLRQASSLTTRAQYSTLVLRQTSLLEWIVGGDAT